MEENTLQKEEVIVEKKEECPVCGSGILIKDGHCTYCYECGWSMCSI